MSDARAALRRLHDGNLRFVSGERQMDLLAKPERRRELVGGQKPFAIVLGCSDSRVPVELVFDQGLGDLFVIRVAGNVVAPSQIGSVEFAAEQFGVRLVVVLGHAECGAVLATLAELRKPADSQSPNLRAIIDRIKPAVLDLAASSHAIDDELVHRAVEANVRASVSALKDGSQFLHGLVEQGEMLVVGAEYSLATGRVAFHEN
jgi:carbonic anhydrase